MDDWDQETLEKAIREKHGAEKGQPNKTEIICKFFLDAVEKRQYGWWVGAVHVLPCCTCTASFGGGGEAAVRLVGGWARDMYCLGGGGGEAAVRLSGGCCTASWWQGCYGLLRRRVTQKWALV